MDKIIRKISHDVKLFEETVIINWCLGNTCNYACTYCPPYLHDASMPWLDYESVTKFCLMAIDHYKIKSGQRLFFEFTGGEVTLYKQFLDLIRLLREKEALVSIISNGSRRIDFWRKARPYLNHICLSYHPETAKADEFKEVVAFLNEEVSVHVNVMMHPNYFETCRELATWVARDIKDVTLAVQPLIVEFKDQLYPYTAEQLDFIKNPQLACNITKEPVKYRGRMRRHYADGSSDVTTGQQLISNGENNWQGWKCSIGVKQIVVDMVGDIYRGWCLEGGKIGNVRDGDKLVFPTAPIICSKKFCHCVLDTMNEREPTEALLNYQIRKASKPPREQGGWLSFLKR